MEKDEILDYVTNTPENTNRAVLGDMLDNYSGGGSVLPAVTSDDNGDVLTVVEGAWGKAAPSGGDNGFFDITIIDWESPAIDKTYAEIVAAIRGGKTIRVIEAGNALYAKASEGSSEFLGEYVSVYPFWIDVSLEDPVQIGIDTVKITVPESGSVTFGTDASFTISGAVN